MYQQQYLIYYAVSINFPLPISANLFIFVNVSNEFNVSLSYIYK